MSNPIVQRELVGLLRTKRAMLLQVLLVALLGLLVILRWPTDALVDISGKQAQEVFRLFGYGLMVMLILLAPVFPATSIVRERREGTLALLLNSPMSPASIFVGKMLGVLGFVLLLIVLSFPAAAACYAMGGVDRTQLISAYAILFVLAVQYAALGLLISSYAATPDSSLRMTYGAILLMAVVTLGPKKFLQGLLPMLFDQIVEWVQCISPIPAMMETLNQSAVGAQGLTTEGGAARRFVILAIISIVIFSVWAASRFSQKMFDRARASGRVTDDQSAGVQRYRRFMFLIDPQRRSELIGLPIKRIVLFFFAGLVLTTGGLALAPHGGNKDIKSLAIIVATAALTLSGVALVLSSFFLTASANPVMSKETRSRRFGRGYWLIRIMSVTLLISLGLMLATSSGTMAWGVSPQANVMVLLSFALVILITPTLASGLISGERESGGWQLLQMTPLSSFTIVTGKLMSVVVTLMLVLLATLPGYAVVVLIDNSMLIQVSQVLLTLLLTAALAVLLSGAVSSLFRRTGPATATAYGLMVGLCAGTMLFWLGENTPFSRSTVETILKVNPLAAALRLIKAPGFADYEIVHANWTFMGIACVVCLAVLLIQTRRLNRPQ